MGGISTKRDIKRFFSGDCHYLAHAISRQTGWPMYAIEYDADYDLHAFVVTPRGTALDARGEQEMTDFLARWDAGEVVNIEGWPLLRRMVTDRHGLPHAVISVFRARRLARRLAYAAGWRPQHTVHVRVA